jgi:hypothetical protein
LLAALHELITDGKRLSHIFALTLFNGLGNDAVYGLDLISRLIETLVRSLLVELGRALFNGLQAAFELFVLGTQESKLTLFMFNSRTATELTLLALLTLLFWG